MEPASPPGGAEEGTFHVAASPKGTAADSGDGGSGKVALALVAGLAAYQVVLALAKFFS